MKGHIFTFAIVALALLASVAVSEAHGQDSGEGGTVIDRILAVVQDRAVLQSDLDAEYERYLMQMQKSSLPADEEKEAKLAIPPLGLKSQEEGG